MKRAFIRNLGVFAHAIGVIFLALSIMLDMAKNTFLFINAAFIVVGLVLYMTLNKRFS